jgi:hypothetical protein
MDNIEYTGHNTESNKIKTKHRKVNRQQSWMDNIEYTRHNTETNKWLPILFSVFYFYFPCLCVVSCVLNVVHSWLLPILFSMFCFYFVCLRVVSCVLNVVHSWLTKNKTQKTKSATIMNGQHWVHRTQHGDKQNKNKT